MDPILLTEAIILATKLCQACTKYIKDVKHAPREMHQITVEAHVLLAILQPLEAFITSNSETPKQPGLEGALRGCLETLKELLKLVEPEEAVGDEDNDESPGKTLRLTPSSPASSISVSQSVMSSPSTPSRRRRLNPPAQAANRGGGSAQWEENNSGGVLAALLGAQTSAQSSSEISVRKRVKLYPESRQRRFHGSSDLVREIDDDDPNDTRSSTPSFRGSPSQTQATSPDGVITTPMARGRKRGWMMSQSRRFRWPLFRKGKVIDLLKKLEMQKSQLQLALQAVMYTGPLGPKGLSAMEEDIHVIEANLNEQEQRSCLSWLKPYDIDLYEFHSQQLDKQEDETCEWLTNSESWRQWLNGGSPSPKKGDFRRFIWVHGIPGAGKTVLASFLIDYVQKYRASLLPENDQARGGSHGSCYFYCHHTRNQDETASMLRCLIRELSMQHGRFISKELADLWKAGDLSVDGLFACFRAISSRFKRVYVIVDAVDESKPPRDKLLDKLIKMGTRPEFRHVSLLITSRDEKDIRDAMQAVDAEDAMDWECDSEDAMVVPPPYTELTMSNHFVQKAIRTYVRKQLNRGEKFKVWTKEFRDEVEETLSRHARGMFRWVACQIEVISRIYYDRSKVLQALADLPEDVFETYERILLAIPLENRDFARTALALICSNTSSIPSAELLVQASLYRVPHGDIHKYNVALLKEILGCLIKVSNLRKSPLTIYKRDDENVVFQKADIAHFTVKEYLYAKTTIKGPAKDFALSSTITRNLEMQVVFHGLQQFGTRDRRNNRMPTRFEEYCLRASEKALSYSRTFIEGREGVWKAVLPCLMLSSAHLGWIRRPQAKKDFPQWATVTKLEEIQGPNAVPIRDETSLLVSLVLLRWPELAQKFLEDGRLFKDLPARTKRAMWADRFIIRNKNEEPQEQTLLQLCVSLKKINFLELFIKAGATFANEPAIVFTALEDPYSNEKGQLDDGAKTGRILRLLLERGADPNPPGFVFTPLQFAVHHLEEVWVQSLLFEGRDANLVGDPDGEDPYDVDAKSEAWYIQHPLEICRTARPSWGDDDGVEEQIARARDRVEQLLIQYGAREPNVRSQGMNPAVVVID
ncbi:hypothetical protein F4778DRAFT_794926 [Xylariomycetidae sp. FL2044]|nr:hypothetical protein F4778DRAFT_794926 [Xylariomycetidae sp. FL2044]